MEIEHIKITDLKPAEYNPRRISDEDYQKLKNSISTFGLVDPIIVNLKNMHIVGGHQRYDVLLDEHMLDNDFVAELPMVRLGDVGFVFTDTELSIRDDDHEKALNLALNKISGEWDEQKLQPLLEELELSPIDIQLTGFSEPELEELNIDNTEETGEGVVEDDYVEPEMYKLLYESAIKNDSDVVECAYFKDYPNKKITSHYIEDRQYKIVKFTPYNAWNKLYKISLFKDSALLFPKGLWYEDLNFNLKLSYFVKKTSFVQVPLYHYVQRDGSIVHTVNNKIFDIYKIVEDIKSFLSEKKDYNFNDVNWYIAKELLVASFFRFCKYDAQNKTKFSKDNYKSLQQYMDQVRHPHIQNHAYNIGMQ